MQALVGVWRADASATLKIQMVRFENPESKNYDGSCCDLFCWSQCDHVFRFALDVGNRCAFSTGRKAAAAAGGEAAVEELNPVTCLRGHPPPDLHKTDEKFWGTAPPLEYTQLSAGNYALDSCENTSKY